MSTTDDPVVENEPPDDDVAIGESPDGDRLGGDQARWLLTNRRKVLIGLGALGSVAAIAEADLGGSGDGNLYGGTMALDKAYKIGPRTYMGPDSVKSNVLSEIDDDEGWRYEATDTQVKYYLDDGAWQGPEGLGSSSTPAGPVHTERANITRASVDRTERDTPRLTGHLNERVVDQRPFLTYPDSSDTKTVIWDDDGSHYSENAGRTWSTTGDSVPTGSNAEYMVWAIQDEYLYAATEEPLELYRSPYSQSGFTWSKVLTAQSGSRFFKQVGKRGGLDQNPETGTMIVGEYNSGADPSTYDPKLYRSTDKGGSWSEVHQITDNNIVHVHCVAYDPYGDQWIATLGDKGNDRFLVSTDDGLTWSRTGKFEVYDGVQATGVDFHEDFIVFAEDSAQFISGPWVYWRDTGKTEAICGEHPARKFDDFMENMINYSVAVDPETGYIYFDVKEVSSVRAWGEVLAYVPYVGADPRLIDKVERARLRYGANYVFNAGSLGKHARYRRIDRGDA